MADTSVRGGMSKQEQLENIAAGRDAAQGAPKAATVSNNLGSLSPENKDWYLKNGGHPTDPSKSQKLYDYAKDR